MREESTTPDLVELAARVREAVNRRDFDALMSFYAPDAVYQGTETGTFEGEAAIRALFEDLMSPFDDVHVEAEEVIDLGNGVMFSALIAKGRPVGSSGELQMHHARVAIWTNGVIEQETNYRDIDEARAAAERLAAERE